MPSKWLSNFKTQTSIILIVNKARGGLLLGEKSLIVLTDPQWLLLAFPPLFPVYWTLLTIYLPWIGHRLYHQLLCQQSEALIDLMEQNQTIGKVQE